MGAASLCGRWTIEQVVAHLTAAASVGPLRWCASVLGARFDFELHNDRRLAEQRGPTPDETLQRFRRVIHHQHHVGARAHRCLAR